MNEPLRLLLVGCLLFSGCVAGRQAEAPETTADHGVVESEESRALPDPMTLSVEEQVDFIFDELGIGRLIATDIGSHLELYQVLVRMLPPQTEEAVLLAAGAVPGILAAEDLLAPAKEHFLEHADKERLAAVFLWLSSELGGSWVGASESVLRGAPMDAEEIRAWIADFYAGVDEDPARRERLHLLRQIEEAAGHGRRTIVFVTASTDALLNALDRHLPEEIRPRDEHVQVVRGAMQATMAQPSVEQAIFDGQLHASRELGVEELQVVLSFYADGPGAWFLDVLEGAKKKAGDALAAELARNLSDAWTKSAEADASGPDDPAEG